MSSFNDSLVTEMERKSDGGQWIGVEWVFNEYPLAVLNDSSNILLPGKCLSTVSPITGLAARSTLEIEAECVCKKALLCYVIRSILTPGERCCEGELEGGPRKHRVQESAWWSRAKGTAAFHSSRRKPGTKHQKGCWSFLYLHTHGRCALNWGGVRHLPHGTVHWCRPLNI